MSSSGLNMLCVIFRDVGKGLDFLNLGNRLMTFFIFCEALLIVVVVAAFICLKAFLMFLPFDASFNF